MEIKQDLLHKVQWFRGNVTIMLYRHSEVRKTCKAGVSLSLGLPRPRVEPSLRGHHGPRRAGAVGRARRAQRHRPRIYGQGIGQTLHNAQYVTKRLKIKKME